MTHYMVYYEQRDYGDGCITFEVIQAAYQERIEASLQTCIASFATETEAKQFVKEYWAAQ